MGHWMNLGSEDLRVSSDCLELFTTKDVQLRGRARAEIQLLLSGLAVHSGADLDCLRGSAFF